MPEVPQLLVCVSHAGTDEAAIYVEDLEECLVQSDTPFDEFGFSDLAEFAESHKISRWAAATADDIRWMNQWSYHADELAVIGWVDAPISRDEVQIDYHRGHGHYEPMVNVKVYDMDLPTGAEFDALLGEHELDPRLAGLDGEAIRDLIETYLENHDEPFNLACSDHFEHAQEQLKEQFFPDYNTKAWTAGRSGGWLVVEGLPEVKTWRPELLTKWDEFTKFCAVLVKDIPRAMAWDVLANAQDEIAGRVHVVTLHMVLCDADLEVGDPVTEWDWDGMLDLSPESTITITKGT